MWYQVWHFQVEMAISIGGVSLWQDVWKYRLQKTQGRLVFLTFDIPQRLHIGGRYEVWLGFLFILICWFFRFIMSHRFFNEGSMCTLEK